MHQNFKIYVFTLRRMYGLDFSSKVQNIFQDRLSQAERSTKGTEYS